MRLSLGLSSCPNDTFIFHAMLAGLIDLEGLEYEPHMADVQKLNELACGHALDVTKVSVGVIPHIYRDYVILSAGGALGWGCGPLLVAKNKEINPETAAIAIPGQMTTANLLLDLHKGYAGPRKEMLFSDILPAVAEGRADLGLIIHEGRFIYSQYGLVKLLDMGQWWEENYKAPLPLGVIVAARSLGLEIIKKIEAAISRSVARAWQNPEKSRDYIRAHAQEMDNAVVQSHIDTFVTEYSQDMRDTGRNAIKMLLKNSLHAQAGDWPDLFV